MTDEYDPDSFDWGDDPGGQIRLDDVGPDVLEDAIRAALDAAESAYGWRYLRRDDVKQSAGRLFKVKYHMPVEKRAWFEEQFPGYTFVWDTATSHHDHPVAHLCTELNEVDMVEDIVRSGEHYIDLFGNSGRDEKYRRNCINLYSLKTPKDYIRYQNPGKRDFPFDLDKLCDPKSAFGRINRITCTHALYYLDMDAIGRIVNTSRKRKFSNLIHRHSATHGELNQGEQEYWVSENGTVEQVNVATGEKYSHPSLEGLFHQGSAKTKHGGVAWTVRAGGGDSFIIDFVGCPNEIAEVYIPLRFLKPESWEEYRYGAVTVKKFFSWTWTTAATTEGRVRIEDEDLFSKLRRYVAGKERSPRLKTETMNYARRLCNKADIISIHGGGASDIPVASMAEYVEVAFYVDVRSELDACLSFHKDNAHMVAALNDYYKEGRLPKDFSAVTKAAVWSGKAFSDKAVAIIDHVRRSQMVRVEDYCSKNLPGEDLRQLEIDYGPDDEIVGPWW